MQGLFSFCNGREVTRKDYGGCLPGTGHRTLSSAVAFMEKRNLCKSCFPFLVQGKSPSKIKVVACPGRGTELFQVQLCL